MMTSLTASFFAGIILGQRCMVFILVPAIAVAVIAAVSAGIVGEKPFWSIALLAVGVTGAVQIGYLIGTGIRTVFRATGAVAPPASRRPAQAA